MNMFVNLIVYSLCPDGCSGLSFISTPGQVFNMYVNFHNNNIMHGHQLLVVYYIKIKIKLFELVNLFVTLIQHVPIQ